MFDFERELMDSVLEMDTELDTHTEDSVYESDIDFTDEMSIAETAVDVEIAEACKKESDGVCEKCGKPIEQCECGK